MSDWYDNLRIARDALDELAAEASDRQHKISMLKFADWLDNALPADDQRVREDDEEVPEWRQRRGAWEAISPSERDRLAIEFLSERPLTRTELLGTFRERLPECMVYESHMRPILGRLLRAGEVEREREAVKHGPGWRWRYSRRRGLSGAIAELDEQFRDEGQEA